MTAQAHRDSLTTVAHSSSRSAGPTAASPATGQQRIALVDLLDRVLAGGVVVAAEVTLSIADVDMVSISLRALVSSVRAGGSLPAGAREAPRP